MQLIIISGPSGSGKTTLAKIILKRLGDGIILNTDNYYKTGLISKILSKTITCYFDRKISFNYKLFKNDFNYICNNSKSEHIYSYDFINKRIKKSYKKKINIEYLIVEGIFAKELLRNFKKHNCLYIQLGTDKESCMNRVINRDLMERGKCKNIAKKDFLKSWILYQAKNYHLENSSKELLYSETTDLYMEIKKRLNLKT